MKYENDMIVTKSFKKGDMIYKEIVSIIEDDLWMHNLPKMNLKIWLEVYVPDDILDNYDYIKVHWSVEQ